jgi:ubiquinone/menaquinone biosynthesis C-methylase UbiE
MLVSALRIWFVRPHPPRAVLAGRQPLAEEPRYNWEPLAPKLFAYRLGQRLDGGVESTIWHLFDGADDEAFVDACGAEQPDVVAFSEIDLLVNEVSRLALRVKRRASRCLTVVGGKQTSLLEPGDRFPFVAIDYAIAGDGVEPLTTFCAALVEGARPRSLPGLVHVDERGVVERVEGLGRRDDLTDIDGIALHGRPVRNHDLAEYLSVEQRCPAPLQSPYRTASVLVSTGCPHACAFCQSPVEYRNESGLVMRRDPASVAAEIAWLVRDHGVGAVFALAPNLELDHLAGIYRELGERGIEGLPIAGFVRAADIVSAERRGLLAPLVAAGLRVLSVGLDIPYGGAGDCFGKEFDLPIMEEAVHLCTARGIALAATVIASPELSASALRQSLEPLFALPLLSVDVRLAIALRNTPYYRRMSRRLIRGPERSSVYFDRQSYRYQTLRVPGGARPRETYRIVSDFNARFPRHPERRRAVGALVAAHPELSPVFGDLVETDDPINGRAVEPGHGRAAGDAVDAADAARGVMEAADRQATAGQAAYDPVADLYACTFADVRVRRAEWRWLESKLPSGGEAAVLDIGCGSGGLLSAISSHIGRGVGLDVSEQMLAHARERNAGDPKVSFAPGDAARTPFADGSFDVVVSFLSLHYLPWPRAIDEIMRVLTSGGRLLCVDMVASPVRRRELHRLVAGKTAVTVQHLLRPRFAAHLRALVRQPAWQAMERRYPLRSLAEYTELAAALGARLEVLTVGAAAKVVAFEAVKRAAPASTAGAAPASTAGADGPAA